MKDRRAEKSEKIKNGGQRSRVEWKTEEQRRVRRYKQWNREE